MYESLVTRPAQHEVLLYFFLELFELSNAGEKGVSEAVLIFPEFERKIIIYF